MVAGERDFANGQTRLVRGFSQRRLTSDIRKWKVSKVLLHISLKKKQRSFVTRAYLERVIDGERKTSTFIVLQNDVIFFYSGGLNACGIGR